MSDVEQAQTGTLGDFLRNRRARLTPEDVGIRAYGAGGCPGCAARSSHSSRG